MKNLATAYTYNPVNKTLTLTGLNVPLSYLLLVVNATRGQIVYNLADPSLAAANFVQGANSVLTLNASVDTSFHDASDALTIFYDDGIQSTTVLIQGPVGPVGPKGDTGDPGTTTWDGITDKPATFAPTSHKSTHAIGGSDAIAPSDIGAATAAQGAKADTALQGNAPAVIDINSTSPALRVTQKGIGDALVVENSTHPDRTPFIIDQYGTCTMQGYDGLINLYTPVPGPHQRVGFDFGTTSSLNWVASRVLLWTFKQDITANNSESFGIRRQKGFSSDLGPIVLNLRQSGNHDANDNWLFTGNVTINGALTNATLETRLAALEARVAALEAAQAP